MGTKPLRQMETRAGSQATSECYPGNLQRAELAAGRVVGLSGRTLARGPGRETDGEGGQGLLPFPGRARQEKTNLLRIIRLHVQ